MPALRGFLFSFVFVMRCENMPCMSCSWQAFDLAILPPNDFGRHSMICGCMPLSHTCTVPVPLSSSHHYPLEH